MSVKMPKAFPFFSPRRFTGFCFLKELKSSSGKNFSLCGLETYCSASPRNQQIQLLFIEHMLGAKHYIYCPSCSQKPCMVDDNLKLEMSKLRLRDTQSHTSSKWQSRDLNLDLSVFNAVF